MADIHGNPVALDAVLEDIKRCGGVDAHWVLGDIVALGPAPVAVLERLSALSNAQCIQGNRDRYVCTGDRPPPTFLEVQADPTLLSTLVEVAGTFAWTQGAVTNGGWFEWLSRLPLEVRTTLPDGTRVLGVHVAPGRKDGLGFRPGLGEDALQAALGDPDADLVCAGHHHQPMDVIVHGTRIVNVGSVSNPLPPDLRACYLLLEADGSGYTVEHRRVAYHRQVVIDAVHRLVHPGAGYIVEHMRGLHSPTGHTAPQGTGRAG